MPTSLNINDIFTQMKQLNKEDQFNLLQKLVLLLKSKEEVKDNAIRITSLAGLGKEVWQGVDIDKYVENERQW